MSAEQVLKTMVSYYQTTGRVMKEQVFVSSIGTKYDRQDIIQGLLMFDDYLDEQREKEGA